MNIVECGSRYEVVQRADLLHQIPKVMIPVQIHVVTMLVPVSLSQAAPLTERARLCRVGGRFVCVGSQILVCAEFASDKVIRLDQGDVETTLEQPVRGGQAGDSRARDNDAGFDAGIGHCPPFFCGIMW